MYTLKLFRETEHYKTNFLFICDERVIVHELYLHGYFYITTNVLRRRNKTNVKRISLK